MPKLKLKLKMNINKEDAKSILQQSLPSIQKDKAPDPQVILSTKRGK